MLAAYGGRCADCGAPDVGLEVHHADGDPRHDAPSNLIALCGACHKKAGAELR
ncbi:MAG: HNH endonuclease [Thermoleophilaceae bacterium]|nr:HNH endonuclease [Thermoleophilaceae bacterium]